MNEISTKELYEMHEAALKAYDSAVSGQMYNGETLDIIVEIRGELDAIKHEIYRRKTENAEE